MPSLWSSSVHCSETFEDIMEGESEVDLSNNNIIPPWKMRRSTPQPGASENMNQNRKARPPSYQSSNRVLVTDFPVEDKRLFTVTQPAEKIVASPDNKNVQRNVSVNASLSPHIVLNSCRGSVPNGNIASSENNSVAQRRVSDHSPHTLNMVLNTSVGSLPNINVTSSENKMTIERRISSQLSLSPENQQIAFGLNPGLVANMNHPTIQMQASLLPQTPNTVSISPGNSPVVKTPSTGNKMGLQRQASNHSQTSEKCPIVLSTESRVSFKTGMQQIIPKGLASEIKTTNKNRQNLDSNRRNFKARSMMETPSAPILSAADVDKDVDTELESPLRRGLRSTSYRRAVVSGIEFDDTSCVRKTHRMSQPNLKAVVEDKERFYSLGKIKKEVKRQDMFEGEEHAVLYQNYKEKALHNDSDEDTEAKEQKGDEKIIVQYKPLQSTWSQLSTVKKNGISKKISQEEKKRQEAIFEVISSEHSYLHSIEILIRMFKDSKELSDTMTKTERHHLFSNITDVFEASKKFLKELDARHQRNVLMDDISDIVERHAMSTFDPYVKYCSNEVYQQRTLQKLLGTNPSFKEVLSRIESHSDCRNLPMISFLILPMQRVTRLPLLMDTICQKTPEHSAKYETCKDALKSVSKLVRQCNEGARRMERTEMMYTINKQLEFKIKPFPLVSSSRWLLKRGELTAFVEDTGIFSKRTSRQQVYFFLFNDVLIITKKKSEESYNVTDYALRYQLSVDQSDTDVFNQSPVKASQGIIPSRQNSVIYLFMLNILKNHAGDKVKMLLGAESSSDRARWTTTLGLSSNDRQSTDRTKLTQVEITRTYTAKQPDELSLQTADVVLVYQKVNDVHSGWYEGERLRDGERGWFPMECAKEITCQATIEKNMQRMGRLLGLETNV
ncbi:rho guanine nucleotide exchange factor 26 isoform X2 [Latimeria chalumnae]|uniref:rho guanine nucleotide exchange factor 26 isoform X2 n=1 Tax=Latimeria chalumnae TaxID=7897 RepID=UPI0006D9041E|nr:PREDICTED: rho guanine nucleotide exchange factor 26 isoform X2 [Latimeria chalumnae]|eukprot:XP_014344125.1 PREDICTED: rho guanine nucleotide exchange factor 26 isoform X2 [Latimeria chalumnae]